MIASSITVSSGGIKQDTIHTSGPVELTHCLSDSDPNACVISGIGAYLYETITEDDGSIENNRSTKCVATEAFRELCEGKPACYFKKANFTSLVPPNCRRENLQGYMRFTYNCTEG